MNNNPIGWPDSAFGYNSSTQTLTAPNVAATKAVTIDASTSYTGNLLDVKVSGTSMLTFTPRVLKVFNGTSVQPAAIGTIASSYGLYVFDETGVYGSTNAIANFTQYYGLRLKTNGNNTHIGFTATDTNAGPDVELTRDGANIFAIRRGTNAQTCRLYNTFTSTTNYERGKLEWTSNTFRVGTEKGSGGGTARSMALQTDATDRLTLDTIGSVRVATALTVATLPGTPTVGMIARVTDASAPTIGSTVAGGGAAAALCWYNGTNWTVLGI